MIEGTRKQNILMTRSDDLYVIDNNKDDDSDNKFELIPSLYYLREDM